MKRKWERIVNRGYDPLPNSPLSAGIGGVALDGLKEGVRKIAAGFGDFSGVIQELESSDKDSSNPHTPRENTNASNARAKRTGSEHLSTSSMSSIPESMHASDHVLDGEEGEAVTMAMAMTVATAPSLARAASLNSRIHKRASRVAKEPTTPTSASVSSPAHSPRSSNLDVGMSLVLAPSPTLVPFPSSAVPTPAPVIGSAHGPVPTTAGPMSSWMDSMGKKLSGIQKGQTYVRRLGTSLLTLTFFSSPSFSTGSRRARNERRRSWRASPTRSALPSRPDRPLPHPHPHRSRCRRRRPRHGSCLRRYLLQRLPYRPSRP